MSDWMRWLRHVDARINVHWTKEERSLQRNASNTRRHRKKCARERDDYCDFVTFVSSVLRLRKICGVSVRQKSGERKELRKSIFVADNKMFHFEIACDTMDVAFGFFFVLHVTRSIDCTFFMFDFVSKKKLMINAGNGFRCSNGNGYTLPGCSFLHRHVVDCFERFAVVVNSFRQRWVDSKPLQSKATADALMLYLA